ncbi:unnamed protein product [Dovyalis caffra]|uniref:UDP-glucose:glycoprotein glucosyltransferase n=1 Tax=Dovyalis caffra TaxID=77055 RepID=A0AAV1SVH8_9ROSI|nr:unnamed protein product [Dovyalis caffra]
MENHFRSSFCVLIILVCVSFCGFGSVSCGENRRPKNVEVAVRAKWEGTPILLEAGELLSKEGKDLYWESIDTWLHSVKEEDDSYTAKDCLKRIIKHGHALLSEPLASLFDFSLILRSASPRLVLYRQLAEESLSSFPLLDDSSSNNASGGLEETNENNEVKRSDPMLVGRNPEIPGGKCCWVDTGAALFYDVAELLLWLRSPTGLAGNSFQQPELFDFDHVHFESHPGSPVTILYGALGTDCFKEFHSTLVKAAKEGRVKYVVRPVLPSGCESKVGQCVAVGASDSLNLGGYGVELALKNMEYKAMDDSAIKKGVTLEDPRTEDLSQEERKPELTSEIMAFRDYLLSSTISDTLDVWELKDLGHQTAQRIVDASDPLQSMQEINQNFPSVVSSLSRMKLNDSVKDEITANQRMIPPGKSLMALNGALINIEDIDLYLLVDLVQQELSLADQFSKLKVNVAKLSLVLFDMHSKDYREQYIVSALYFVDLNVVNEVPHSTIRKLLSTMSPPESNMIRVDFRSSHVHYLNNLEEDSMYKRWRNNINEILMPVFPGQLRYIRKNLFHAVYVLDPATSCGLEASFNSGSVNMILSLYENNFPMRFGLILYSSKFIKKVTSHGLDVSAKENDAETEDISSLMIRLFIYIKESYGTQTAFQFLSNVNRLRMESDPAEDVPQTHHVDVAFVETILPKVKAPPQEILLKLEKEQTYKELSQESSMFVFKLGLNKLQCCLLMNGLVFDSSEEVLMNAMNDELTRIQEQVYYGHINSRTDVLDKFLSESGISRYNPQIIAQGKVKPRFISLASGVLGVESVMNDINFLHSPGTIDDLKPITHLLAVDFASKKGIKLLHEGIRYLIEGSKGARLGVLFSSNQDSDLPGLLLAKVFEITTASYSHKKNVLNFLAHVCSFYEQKYILASPVAAESTQTFVDKVYDLADANELPLKAYKSTFSEFSVEEMKKQLNKVSQFFYQLLGLESGVNAVITNGRVMFPGDEEAFLSHDLHLLETMEFKQRVKHIAEIIEEVQWQDVDPDMLTSKFVSDAIMYVSSAMATRERSSESARFEILSAEHSAVIIDNENSSVHIDAVVDPLSTAGQKVSSLLRVLRKYVQPSMRIVLNPMLLNQDDPIWRPVDPSALCANAYESDLALKMKTDEGALFSYKLVTLASGVGSLVDLPLKNYYRYVVPTMDDFSSTDFTVNGPKAFFANMPLSKTLTMNLDVPEPWLVEPVIAVHDLDNILLENLGDTRTLQAVFELEALVLTGRSSELYALREDADGTQEKHLSKRITINDLRGKVVHLEVVKKKGMEHEKLLISSDDDNNSQRKGTHDSWNSNLFKWASGFIGSNSKKNENALAEHGKSGRRGKTINIFSIASGHLQAKLEMSNYYGGIKLAPRILFRDCFLSFHYNGGNKLKQPFAGGFE